MKNVKSKKTQPASTTEHCQEARCFAFCYHLLFSLPFALLMNHPALICKMPFQQSNFPSFQVWCPHRGKAPSRAPTQREDLNGEAQGSSLFSSTLPPLESFNTHIFSALASSWESFPGVRLGRECMSEVKLAIPKASLLQPSAQLSSPQRSEAAARVPQPG